MPLAQDDTQNTPTAFRIGDWEVLPPLNELRRGESIERIEPKAMALLVLLARRADEVVSRDELFSAVWPGLVVSDDTLTQAIIKLRKALGDRARAATYIQTIPKKGYRLIAEVNFDQAPSSSLAAETRLRKGVGRWWPFAGLMIGVFGLLLAAAALLFPMRGPVDESDAREMSDAPVESGLPTLSVLPFTALGETEDDLILAQGLTLDLVTDLSKLSGLWVIGSRSILGQSAESAQRVRARYRVSGDVQRSGGRLRIHVRLFDAETNLQIWSDRFNRPFIDLFTMQEEISRQIAAALTLQVSETEHRRLAQRYTRNVEAYEAFLRGQSLLLVRQRPENDLARAMYRRAITLDPTFGRAYAGLALTYAADYRNQWVEDGPSALKKAWEMAVNARKMDPEIPEVYWVLAYVNAQQRNHHEALELLAKAVSLDQSFADAYALMGGINTYIGKPEKSVDLLRTAIRLNPEAGYLYFLLLGRAYFFTGDWDQAGINLREALARNPANLEARVFLAATEGRSGDREGAVWEAEEILALEPGYSTRSWLETYPMVDRGQQDALLSALADLGL